MVVGKSAARFEPDSTESLQDDLIMSVIKPPRKSAKHIHKIPVPQTDTGGRVEYIKALE